MSEHHTPRVSVIIPVYNSMPYVTGTLESVLAQDLSSFEVIAIDDGSTDGSGEELDRFAELDDRLVVVHQPNSGWPGMPRNRGIERAIGEFVFFMDSDDTMAPNALRAMVEMADDAAQDQPADVVIPRFEGTGGRGVQSLFARHPQGRISIARAMETLSPQKLFRRELIERAGLRFPEEQVRLEDGIFVTQAYTLARRILFCGRDPLYFIALRDDGQNISSQEIDPENYVASCRRISELLIDGTPDREAADRLVLQFFQRKGLRFYVPKRWSLLTPEARATWVSLHQAFLHDLIPARLDATVRHPTERRKLAMIRVGDVAGLEALISAQPRLDHDALLTAVTSTSRGIELRMSIVPTGADSLLDQTPPAARLHLMNGLDRALSLLGANQYAISLNQRLAALLTRGAPRARLMLNGRRGNRTVVRSGRLISRNQATGTLDYAFVLSPELLQSFGRDRVDLWTVAGGVDGRTGARVRVRATGAAIPAGASQRVYATARGNVSLRPGR